MRDTGHKKVRRHQGTLKELAMINTYITELVNYGVREGLVDGLDRTYTINRLIELFGLIEYEEPEVIPEPRELHLILEDMISWALGSGVLESDTTAAKDLFDTKIMGLITPPPSVVIRKFNELAERSSRDATDWYYAFSRATNYIRTDRIVKDEKWGDNVKCPFCEKEERG